MSLIHKQFIFKLYLLKQFVRDIKQNPFRYYLFLITTDIPERRPNSLRISVSGYMGVNKRGQLPRALSRRVFTADF